MNIKAVRAAVVDFIFVLAFVVIGRKSHGHGETISGIFSTFWPFLVGLVIGWISIKLWKNPTQTYPKGILLWLSTVAVRQRIQTSYF